MSCLASRITSDRQTIVGSSRFIRTRGMVRRGSFHFDRNRATEAPHRERFKGRCIVPSRPGNCPGDFVGDAGILMATGQPQPTHAAPRAGATMDCPVASEQAQPAQVAHQPSRPVQHRAVWADFLGRFHGLLPKTGPHIWPTSSVRRTQSTRLSTGLGRLGQMGR